MEIDMELKSFIVLYDGKFIRVYKENDADRYIAELQSANQLEIDEWYNKLMHQKYKRCLDKAEWCEKKKKRLEAISPMFDTSKECWEYGSDYWNKWHKRWLELAKQFNPNSTATKENNNG